MAVLIDTSFFVALAFSRDKNHELARKAMREIRGTRIVVTPVLPELFYLILVRVGYDDAIKSFTLLRSRAFQIETLTESDMARMEEIMIAYRSAHFDFADAAIMAAAERLNITQVYTFDRRDFSIFRPVHAASLMLLP